MYWLNSITPLQRLNLRELESCLGLKLDQIYLTTEIKNCLWDLSQADPESLVFYELSGDTEAESKFEKRIQNSDYALVIVNREFKQLRNYRNVIVMRDFFEAQKHVLDWMYPLPKGKRLIGITGTNGKTSTVDFCRQLADCHDEKVFSIGTIGVLSDLREPKELIHTTPLYIDLRKILYEYFKDHSTCFMEVSSHGISLNRIYKFLFDVVGWTNLTQDHLDFHEDMDDYFHAKLKLFTDHTKEGALRFVSREQYELCKRFPTNMSYMVCDPLESFELSDLPKEFGVGFYRQNLELALNITKGIWGYFPKEKSLKLVPPIGRFQIINWDYKKIVIDYAHTPDALRKVCEEARKLYPKAKLAVVFGCGGDRDRSKRPLMGAIAEELCDSVFLTSDNPRTENPDKIISEILSGMRKRSCHHVRPDRKEAIREAMKTLDHDGVLVIAGKGHENYQVIGTEKRSFSDVNIVREIIDA